MPSLLESWNDEAVRRQKLAAFGVNPDAQPEQQTAASIPPNPVSNGSWLSAWKADNGVPAPTPKVQPEDTYRSHYQTLVRENPDVDTDLLNAGIQEIHQADQNGQGVDPGFMPSLADLTRAGTARRNRLMAEQQAARAEQDKANEAGYLRTIGSGLIRGTEGMAEGVNQLGQWGSELVGADSVAQAFKEGADYWKQSQQEGLSKPDPYTFRGSFLENPSLKRAVGTVSEAIPSLAASMMTGGASRALGAGRLAQGLIGAGAFGSLEGAGQYSEAREAGEDVASASTTGALSTLGTTILEAIPVGRFLTRMGGGLVKNTLKGMAEEGLTESAQQVWQNSLAKYGYDKTRSLVDGVVESFIGGAGAGGITSGVMGKINEGALNRQQQQLADTLNLPVEDVKKAWDATAEEINKNRPLLERIFTDEEEPTAKTVFPKLVEQAQQEAQARRDQTILDWTKASLADPNIPFTASDFSAVKERFPHLAEQFDQIVLDTYGDLNKPVGQLVAERRQERAAMMASGQQPEITGQGGDGPVTLREASVDKDEMRWNEMRALEEEAIPFLSDPGTRRLSEIDNELKPMREYAERYGGQPPKAQARMRELQQERLSLLEEARPKPATAVPGQDTIIRVPTEKEPIKARWALMEADEVIPSHNAETFGKHPRYPGGVQERAYHTDKEEQGKVVSHATGLKPDLVLSPTTTMVDGPPAVTPEGWVLGGNSRAMSIQRHYAGPTRGEQYKKALAAAAGQTGFTAEQVMAMKKPVLVRMIQNAPSGRTELHRLASAMNKNFTQEMGERAKTASLGVNVPPAVLSRLGNRMAESDTTIRGLLDDGKQAREVLNWLVEGGVVPANELGKYWNQQRGAMTAEGKALVERSVLGSIIPDQDLLEYAPAELVRKIEKGLPALAKIISRGDDWRLAYHLREALQVAEMAKKSHGGDVDAYMGQTSFVDQKDHSPVAVALAKALIQMKPTEFRDALNGYATDAAADIPGQEVLFETETPASSFARHFAAVMPAEQQVQFSQTGQARGGQASLLPKREGEPDLPGAWKPAGEPTAEGQAIVERLQKQQAKPTAATETTDAMQAVPVGEKAETPENIDALEREMAEEEQLQGQMRFARGKSRVAKTTTLSGLSEEIHDESNTREERLSAMKEAGRLVGEAVVPRLRELLESSNASKADKLAALKEIGKIISTATPVGVEINFSRWLEDAVIEIAFSGTHKSLGKVVLTGGPPGAGKSFSLKQANIVESDFVPDNADWVKELLGLDRRASDVHEQSSRIAKKILTRAQQENVDFIYDSLLSNFEVADKIVGEELAKGHEVYIPFNNISAETSMARAFTRFIQQELSGRPGRDVPLSASVKGFNRALPVFMQILDKYKDNPGFSYMVVDNDVDGRKAQVLAQHNVRGKSNFVDKSLANIVSEVYALSGGSYERKIPHPGSVTQQAFDRIWGRIERGIEGNVKDFLALHRRSDGSYGDPGGHDEESRHRAVVGFWKQKFHDKVFGTQQQVEPLPAPPLFARRQAAAQTASATTPVTVEAVESVLVPQRLRFTNLPLNGVRVVQSAFDLPKPVAEQANMLALKDGTRIQGVYDPVSKRVYIVAGELDSAEEAPEKFLHEVVGHFGLRGVMGKRLDNFLDSIYLTKAKGINNLARDLGLDVSDRDQRREACEEWFARQVERGTLEPTLWERFKRAFFEVLKKMGLEPAKLTDDDIRSVILAAARYAEGQSVSETARTMTQQKQLVVTHGLSASKLKQAVKLGGLIGPSLAIQTSDQAGSLVDPNTKKQYGDIVMVGRADLANPKVNPNVVVYNDDAYTPMFPRLTAAVGVEPAKLAGFVNKYLSYFYEHLTRPASLNLALARPEIEVRISGERGPDGKRRQRLSLDKPMNVPAVLAAFMDQAGIDHSAVIEKYPVEKIARAFRDLPLEKQKQQSWVGYGYWDELKKQFGGEKEAQAAIDQWLTREIGVEFLTEPVMTDPSGFGIYSPENGQVETMRRDRSVGATSPTGFVKQTSLENVALLPSVESMHQAEGRLQPAGNVLSKLQALEKRSRDLAERSVLPSAEVFNDSLRAEMQLHFAIRRGAESMAEMKNNLTAEGFVHLTPEYVREVYEFARDIKDVPVGYFEAKVFGKVGFDQFVAAVMPKGTPLDPDTLDALKQAGLIVKTYDPTDPKAFRQAVDYLSRREGVRFARRRTVNPNQMSMFGQTEEGQDLFSLAGEDYNKEDAEKALRAMMYGEVKRPQQQTLEGVEDEQALRGDDRGTVETVPPGGTGEAQATGTVEGVQGEEGQGGERLVGEADRTGDASGRGGRDRGVGSRLRTGPRTKSISRINTGNAGLNYRISEADNLEGGGGKVGKYDRNVAAIKLLKQIEQENRTATREEQAVLVKYVGWGGLAQDIFNRYNRDEAWQRRQEELKELLTPEEYESARNSTPNAHYTSPQVIKAIYGALERLGFNGGRILEPSMGVGHFFGLLPGQWPAQLSGVELDSVTGRIAKQLYQGADVRVQGFQDAKFPDGFFDLIVGNVPFGDYTVADKKYDKYRLPIHDYFFVKSLDKVRPGGLVAFVTSTGTMDKKNGKVRELIAQKGRLVTAFRLPGNAFKALAGTDVTTDVIILQRYGEKERPDLNQEWLISKLYDVSASTPPIVFEGREYTKDEFEAMIQAARDRHNEALDNRFTGSGSQAKVNEARDKFFSLNSALDEWKAENQGGQFSVNSYYQVHPENLLGRIVPDKLHPQRAGLAATGNLENQLARVINSIKGQVYSAIEDRPADPVDNQLMMPAPDEIKPFAFYEDGGKIYQKVDEKAVPYDGPDAERIRSMIGLRSIVRETLRNQLDGRDETLSDDLKRLNDKYDDFIKGFGILHDKRNLKAFEEDPDVGLLLSLEKYDADTKKASKADIFRRRVLARWEPATSAVDAKAGLSACLYDKGRVDIAHIAKLVGISEEAIIDDLGTLIYQDPEQGDKWLTADEYLSGDVRHKLEMAQAAMASNPDYKRNVEALEAVQPEDLKSKEISARLGTPWVPPHIVRQFVVETLGIAKWDKDFQVKYLPETAQWVMEGVEKTNPDNFLNVQKWGTRRVSAMTLIEDAMNLKRPAVYDVDPKTKERSLNQKETIAAEERQTELKREFEGWVWRNESRAAELARLYNDEYNSVRLRKFDGSHIADRPAGMSLKYSLRDYQKAGLWRILQGKNVLLAHGVGTGKTMTMAAAAMELRRLGLARKPMFVVPKHLIAGWKSRFQAYYPTAKTLVASEDDLSPLKRAEFMARIATGDWDAVVVTIQQFGKLPISQETQRGFLEEQLKAFEEAIEREMYIADKSGQGVKKSKTVKKLVKARNRLEAKIKTALDQEDRDAGVTFEELGVDYLFVDESHKFKNLEFVTRQTQVAGIASGGSESAWDMYVKSQYINQMNNGRGIIFATGTPISNSMGEMFTLLRYLDRRSLSQLGLSQFDAWAAQFGDIVTEYEVNVTGEGYRQKSRFNRFVNIPEMQNMFRTLADVVHSGEAGIERPAVKGGKAQVVSATATPAVTDYVKSLGSRMDRLKAGVDPRIDNALKITTEGRKAALDLRLVMPGAEDNPGSKVNKMVETVVKIYEETKPQRSTQLIFCDLSTPLKKGEKGFSVYDDVREKLIKAGVDKKEIAFIHDAETDQKKEALFEAMRAGQIRILMGSTMKMGEGMNVQTKLIAQHDLDAPWRPSDVEQREGRIVRHGNENKEVQLYRYVTQGTFDAYIWQLLENKAKFITQVMSDKVGERTAEDVANVALSYAEVKALASGNPLILDKIKIETTVRRLSALEAAWKDNKYDLQRGVNGYPVRKNLYESNARGYEESQQAIKPKPGDKDFVMVFDGRQVNDRIAAGKHIYDTFARQTQGEGGGSYDRLAEYRGVIYESKRGPHGLDVRAWVWGHANQCINFDLKAPDHYAGEATAIPVYLREMDGVADSFGEYAEHYKKQLRALESDYEHAQGELKKPFEHARELEEATRKLEDIKRQLGIDDLSRNRQEQYSVGRPRSGAESVAQLKNEFDNLYSRRRYVQIADLRKALDWPATEFDRVIDWLATKGYIALQEGGRKEGGFKGRDGETYGSVVWRKPLPSAAQNAIERIRATQKGEPASQEDVQAFKAAYDEAFKQRQYVYIHEVRKALGWPRDRFDRVLDDMMVKGVVAAFAGNPARLSADEIRDSYRGRDGELYLSVQWRGKGPQYVLDKIAVLERNGEKLDAIREAQFAAIAQAGPQSAGQAVSDEDLQDIFKGDIKAGAKVSRAEDGSVSITYPNGRTLKVETVNWIDADTVEIEASHGKGAGPAVGKFWKGTITLRRDADKWVLGHEHFHHLTDMGVINALDYALLAKKAAAFYGKDKASNEDVANYYAEQRVKRDGLTGTMARIVAKVEEFIDRLVNLVHRTAGGVLRDIESGQAFGRTVETQEPAPSFAVQGEFISKDGSVDLGFVTEELAKKINSTAAPIRLSVASEQYIDEKHGDQIRAAGYPDVKTFVAEVSQGYQSAYPGFGKTIILAVRNQLDKLVFVSMSPSRDGSYFKVNNAFLSRPSYLDKKTPLWEVAQLPPGYSEEQPPKKRIGKSDVDKNIPPDGEAVNVKSGEGEPEFSTGRSGNSVNGPWTQARLKKEIQIASYPGDKTRAMISWVNPAEFLRVTTPDDAFARDISNRAKILRRDDLAKETQSPFLDVREEDGTLKIVGHEGRHRMAALAQSGVTRVPVVLDFGRPEKRETKENLTLTSEHAARAPLMVTTVMPLQENRENALLAEFVNQPARVRYSTGRPAPSPAPATTAPAGGQISLGFKETLGAVLKGLGDKLRAMNRHGLLGQAVTTPEWDQSKEGRALVAAATVERDARKHQIFNKVLNWDEDNKGLVSEFLQGLRDKGLSWAKRFKGIDLYGRDDALLSPEYREIKGALLHMDETGEHWDNAPRGQKSYREKLVAKGVSADVIKGVDMYRKSMDRALELMRAQLKEVIDAYEAAGKPVPVIGKTKTADGKEKSITLADAYNEMGELKGHYMPRIREAGDYHVLAMRGDQAYRFGTSNNVSARLLEAKLQKEGYTETKIEKVERLPESIYQDLQIMSVSKALEDATGNMKDVDPETQAKLRMELIQSASDMLKARAMRAHRIGRVKGVVVKGFIEDPLTNLLLYNHRIAGGIAKGETAMKMLTAVMGEYKQFDKDLDGARWVLKDNEGNVVETRSMTAEELAGDPGEKKSFKVGGVNPTKQSDRYNQYIAYITEQLRNTDRADAVVGIGKAIATLKYLGFSPRSALVNTTAQITAVPPALHEYILGGKGGNKAWIKIGRALKSSSVDYARVMAGKKLANTDEQAFLDDVKDNGQDQPQLVRDSMAAITSGYSRAWEKLMSGAMWMFGKTEQWNRGTTMLAGYRLARAEGHDHKTAMKMAVDVSNKAHGLYGRGTLPSWAMGQNPAARVFQMAYTFQKFGHNYLQMLYDIGVNKKNYRAATFALAAPAVIGGVGGSLAYTVAMAAAKVIMKAFGDDDDPEKLVADTIRENLGKGAEQAWRFGALGVIPGVDISASLAVGMEVPATFKDLLGPVGGLIGDLGQAKEYLDTGQTGRMLETLLPTGLANVPKALREKLEGATTSRGNRIWDEDGKPYFPSGLETGLRVAGFRSADRAVVQERTWEAKKEAAKATEKRTRIYEAYRAWLASTDRDAGDYQNIIDDIAAYNEAVARKGRGALIPSITMQSLRRQSRKMERPSRRELEMVQN